MKNNYILFKWNDLQIDSVLFSFHRELIRIDYQLDILDFDKDCIEYKELVSYKSTIVSTMELILGKLKRVQFDQLCDIKGKYHFLKFDHFQSFPKVQESEFVTPAFEIDGTEIPFRDIDFESFLKPVDDEDAQIMNKIGQEKLIKIIKELHIGL
ncbi:MAG: hypothetical protein RO257_14555 [Candidatus Kapabacteria bacterium]|nr:hypothetical protein [Candidatus Kapabacteria bacterium]